MLNDSPHSPIFPDGWTAQPVRRFHDPSGRFSYELNLVYAPTRPLRNRVDVEGQLLDEGKSFWLTTWSTSDGDGDERPAGRWLTYAAARAQLGRRLTFARFSSLDDMRDELPDLLHRQDQARVAARTAPATSVLDVFRKPRPSP